MRPQNPSAGVPAGNQLLGCLLQCPKTPHNHYGTLHWVPQGTLGPAKLVKFSLFFSQICLTKLPKPPRVHPVQPQNSSAGGPAGNQVLGCLLQCPKTPHNQYGALTWGPLGTLGPAKLKQNHEFHPFRGPRKKHKSKSPEKRKNAKKNRNSAKMRPFHQTFLPRTVWPICSG